MPKPLLAAAVGVGVLATSMLVAAPVRAAALPDGDALYTISCAVAGQSSSALYRVDADSAAVEQVGAQADDCATGGAIDPSTGIGYYISRPGVTGPVGEASLSSIDLTTGARTVIGPMPTANELPVSLAIGPQRQAYALGYYSDLYAVDLDTGAVETLGNLGQGQDLDAFAVDPASGLFYAVSASGQAFRVDVSNAEVTPIGRLLPDADRYGGIAALQIDSDGRWWINARSDGANPGQSHLYSSTLPSGDTVPEFEGVLDGVGGPAYMASQTLLLKFTPRVPSPQGPANLVPTDRDRFYTVSCSAVIHGRVAALYQLDAGSGLATLVGASDTGLDRDCPTGAAYDPRSGSAYYFSEFRPSAAGRDTRLVRIDLDTGLSTVVGTVAPGRSPFLALAIGPEGAAYAITAARELYSIDLNTADLSFIGQLPIDEIMCAFSMDPSTGLFYGVTLSGQDVWQIDVATAGAIPLGSFAGITYALALQIDPSGRWWLNATGPSVTPMLYSTQRPDRATTLAEPVGAIDVADGARNIASRTLLIAPAQHGGFPPGAPTGPGAGSAPLPRTGSGDLAPLLIGGLVLLVLGGLSIGVRRQVS